MTENKKQKYYLLTWKQQNIMTWKEENHEAVFDNRAEAEMTAKVGKDIFGEDEHKIIEIGEKEAIAIKQEQEAKRVRELERFKRLERESK